MKRIFAAVLVFCLMLSFLPAVTGESSEKQPRFNVYGFDLLTDEFIAKADELIEMTEQKKWADDTVPVTLDEFPVVPEIIFTLDSALSKVNIKMSHKSHVHTCVTNLKDVFDLAETAFTKKHTDEMWFGDTQRSGGENREMVSETEPYTYVEDNSKYPEYEKGVKCGTHMLFIRKWYEQRWNAEIGVQKSATNGSAASFFGQNVYYGVNYSKGYRLCWGCNGKQHTFIFNLRNDNDEEKGCFFIYNTKSRKLQHFQYGGVYLVTRK